MNKSNLNTVRETLRAYGVPFTISTGNGKHHTHVTYVAHGVTWKAPISLSPSDRRAESNVRRQIRRVMEGYVCLKCQRERIQPGRVWCDSCREKYPNEVIPTWLNEPQDSVARGGVTSAPCSVARPSNFNPSPTPTTISAVSSPPPSASATAPTGSNGSSPSAPSTAPAAPGASGGASGAARTEDKSMTTTHTAASIARLTGRSHGAISKFIKDHIPESRKIRPTTPWQPGHVGIEITGYTDEEIVKLVQSKMRKYARTITTSVAQPAPTAPTTEQTMKTALTEKLTLRLERLSTTSQLTERQWVLVQKIAAMTPEELAIVEALLS